MAHAVEGYRVSRVVVGSGRTDWQQSAQHHGEGVKPCAAAAAVAYISSRSGHWRPSGSSRIPRSEDGCCGRDPRWDQTDCGFCQRFSHSGWPLRPSRSCGNPSSSPTARALPSHVTSWHAAAQLIATSQLIAVRRRL